MISFEDYVALRGPALVRLARLLTGDDHRAEDLVQDILGRAFVRWRSIMRTDSPDVYLRRMLLNAHTSWWRRRLNKELPIDAQSITAASDREASKATTIHNLGAQAANRDAMWRLILRLPDRQRAVIVLRYYEDLDDATIAEVLDCSPATVRTHAMRALKTLRAHLPDTELAREGRKS